MPGRGAIGDIALRDWPGMDVLHPRQDVQSGEVVFCCDWGWGALAPLKGGKDDPNVIGAHLSNSPPPSPLSMPVTEGAFHQGDPDPSYWIQRPGRCCRRKLVRHGATVEQPQPRAVLDGIPRLGKGRSKSHPPHPGKQNRRPVQGQHLRPRSCIDVVGANSPSA